MRPQTTARSPTTKTAKPSPGIDVLPTTYRSTSTKESTLQDVATSMPTLVSTTANLVLTTQFKEPVR